VVEGRERCQRGRAGRTAGRLWLKGGERCERGAGRRTGAPVVEGREGGGVWRAVCLCCGEGEREGGGCIPRM
jgi:hypothetical protein